MHQNAAEQENGASTASEHHGLTMVAATVVVPLPLPGCVGFLRPFVFPRDYSSVCVVFAFKSGMYLALGRARIHRLDSPSLSKTPLKKKKGGEAKVTLFVANRKIGTRHCISFLNFSFFLSFSSILVRICFICWFPSCVSSVSLI